MAKQFDNSPSMWEERIRKGIVYRKKYGGGANWRMYRKYFRGFFPGYRRSTKGILPLNIVFSILKTLLPNTYYRNPYINVTPRKGVFVDMRRRMMARVMESADNWLIQELEIKQTIQQMIRGGYFTGTGVVKNGYDSQFGFFPADQGEPGTSQLNKKGNAVTEYNQNIKPGMPWANSVASEFFIVPFGCKRLRDAEWVDHMILRKLVDVKTDPKTQNTSKLHGTHMELLQQTAEQGDFYSKLTSEEEWVELHEIHDVKRREVKCFVTGQDWWLWEPREDVMQVDGLPFTELQFNVDDEIFWAPSDVSIIEPQQLEVNEARTQAMYHRRVALLKVLYERNSIKDTEFEKLMSEQVMVGVATEGDPKKVATLQPHIPADIMGWTEAIRGDAREQLGIGRNQTGEMDRTRRTAREAGIVEVSSQVRLDDRRDAVAEAVRNIMRKINQTCFEYWDKERVVEVVGVDAARYWVSFTKKEIKGEYDLKVDVESMSPVTKELRKKEVMQLLGVLMKTPQANITPLLKHLVANFDWTDTMEIFPEAPETQGQPMGANQFAQQQQKLLQEPGQLRARIGQNKNYVANTLPGAG